MIVKDGLQCGPHIRLTNKAGSHTWESLLLFTTTLRPPASFCMSAQVLPP